MKCITILLLAATTSIASAQNFQMTSSVNTPYNAYDSSVYDTTLYHYAVGQSKPDTATTLHWSTSNHHWANYSRHYASYTSTKKPAIEARQDWNNTTQQWNDIYRDSFAYNSLDSLINHSRLFAVQGGGWTNGPRFVYTYDINNDLVTNLGQGWSNNTWVNAARISYTYNSQHQSLTEHHEWSNNNVQWFEALKYDISYSANTIVRVCSVFNTPGNNYFVYDRETYAFSGNDTTSILFEKPQNGSWVNSQQKQFIYNTGKITNTTLQAWNGTTYANEAKIDFAYNSNNLLASITPMTWTNNSWQAANTDTTQRFYYSPIQPNNISTIKEQNEILIWPQPANNFIQIETNCEAEISLIDVSGKIAKKTTGSRIETTELPSGTYVLKIQRGPNLSYKRAVIQH